MFLAATRTSSRLGNRDEHKQETPLEAIDAARLDGKKTFLSDRCEGTVRSD